MRAKAAITELSLLGRGRNGVFTGTEGEAAKISRKQLASIAQTAEALKQAASAVATSTGVIREGVRREEGEVSGGLEATESLAQVSRRVSDDGAGAARASTAASDVASRNRTQIQKVLKIRGQIGGSRVAQPWVALEAFVGNRFQLPGKPLLDAPEERRLRAWTRHRAS